VADRGHLRRLDIQEIFPVGLTSVPPGRQAATLTAAMKGVAKILALRIPLDEMFSDTGVESPCALLRSRFGNAGSISRKIAFDGRRSSTRGATTMEEYLVAFDEAISLCEEAGRFLRDAMQVHIVVDGPTCLPRSRQWLSQRPAPAPTHRCPTSPSPARFFYCTAGDGSPRPTGTDAG